MQKLRPIKPCLRFDGNAKEAVDYYVSVFPESKIINTKYYPNSTEEGLADFQKDTAGKEWFIDFELKGQKFIAFNGGSEYKFNEAISLVVSCKDQAEIDYYWKKLSSVPEAEQSGWCQDRFGLSWQVEPENVDELMERPNAFDHILKMKKIIIDDL